MLDEDILLKQIIETDNIIGTKYYQFLEISIKMKDRSRFNLIDFPVSILRLNRVTDKIGKNKLHDLLNPTLFRVNQLIIDNDDFVLFKYQVNSFSYLHLRTPIEIRDNLEHEFYLISDVFHMNRFKIKLKKEFEEKIEYFKFLVRYNLFRNFESWDQIDDLIQLYQKDLLKELDGYKNKEKLKSLHLHDVNIDDQEVYKGIIRDIDISEERLNQIIQGSEKLTYSGISPNLYEFWISSLIYKTFFMIGSYLVFCNRNKDLNGANYIRELWFHTKPTDKNETTILADTPVIFDSSWLIFLYLFGGKGSMRWSDWPNYVFDDYHEGKQYITQYFLLCLAKSKKIDIFPTEKLLNSLKSKNMTSELENLFDLVYGFYLMRSDLIDNIELLINENEKWETILSYKEMKDGEEIVVTAKDALSHTKDSLIELMHNLDMLCNEIINLLPFDSDKIDHAIAEINKWYENKLKLSDIFESRDNDEKDSDINFVEIEGIKKPIERKCFVKLGTVLYHDCDIVWSNAARNITLGEIKYLNKIVSECDDIPSIILNDLEVENVYNKIVLEAKNLKKNCNIDMLIIPSKFLFKFRKFENDPNSPLHKKFDFGDNNLLKIDDDFKLKIIHLHEFNDFLLLDSKSINCIYKTDSNSNGRIFIDFKESNEDLSNVDIYVKAEININIINPKCIRLFSSNTSK